MEYLIQDDLVVLAMVLCLRLIRGEATENNLFEPAEEIDIIALCNKLQCSVGIVRLDSVNNLSMYPCKATY